MDEGEDGVNILGMYFSSIGIMLYLPGFFLTGGEGVIRFCNVGCNLLKNNYEEQ